MSRIRILSDHLVSQIAAGEVVERPASVVKELVENALDAGAREISVELEAGGKRRIRVIDDGGGMDRDDALLAFDRHATSKIETFEDLEAVATLGFRGEALASIAAVARVELLTAVSAEEGFRVHIEGGRVRSAEPAAAAPGSTLDVRSLFFNVPARRSFLKTPRTELRRATEVVQGYALACPEIGFRLTHDGRQVLEAPGGPEGREGLRRRIEYVFGPELARRLTPIDSRAGLAETLWGFVGDPSTSRGQRRFVFVNRRLIRDRAVLATFYRAVRDEWRVSDFPALFLFIDVPGHEVDVNVHPQKAEVRFRDGRLLQRVYGALREALGAARGEEPAPARPATGLPRRPLAWQGALGADPEESRGRFDDAGDVRESPFAPRLPEVTYAPGNRPIVPLSGRSGEPRSFRLLGQYKGTLLLLEGEDGLYLIDQHVAHERILYERIRRNLEADRPQSQVLIEPLVLDLAVSEAQGLAELADGLGESGFEVAPLSGASVAVHAVPAGMRTEQAAVLLEQLLRRPQAQSLTASELRRALLEEAAASMACRAAVKMHDPLGLEEMQRLVSELFETSQPYTCPHGRPVILKLSDIDLETRFKRR